MKLVFDNKINNATLTATPSMLSTLPVDNVKLSQRGAVARSVGLPASQVIWGNLQSVFDIDSLGVCRHNLSSAATIRLRLYSSYDRAGTLTFDSGVVSIGEGVALWGSFLWGEVPIPSVPVGMARNYASFFASARCASFELTIVDTGNTLGYMDIGRLVLGKSVSISPSAGLNVSWQDGSKHSRTEGGSLRTEAKGKWRVCTMDIAYLDTSERNTLSDALYSAGMPSDVLLSAYEGSGGNLERDGVFVGKLTRLPDISEFARAMWRSALTIEEV